MKGLIKTLFLIGIGIDMGIQLTLAGIGYFAYINEVSIRIPSNKRSE